MAPTYFGASDIPGMLEDMGVTLALGGATTKALLDQADEEILNATAAPVTGKAIVFTIQTGALPGLAMGSEVVSEAVTYKVRLLQQIEDGALTRVLCSLPT